MEKAILETSIRAKENIHLHLGGTACKSEVKSMDLKPCQGGCFAGLPHLFIDSSLEAAAPEISPEQSIEHLAYKALRATWNTI